MTGLSVQESLPANRRLQLRQDIRAVAYVELGQDNGGILLNVSEGGVLLQAAFALADKRVVQLRFRLPKSNIWVKADGQIVWLGSTKKLAGVCFVDLSDGLKDEIKQWIRLELNSIKVERPNPQPRLVKAPHSKIAAVPPLVSPAITSTVSAPLDPGSAVPVSLQEPPLGSFFGRLIDRIRGALSRDKQPLSIISRPR